MHIKSQTVRLRERAVLHLCGGYFYCVGLARLGGSNCPCPLGSLTVEDIQVAHIRKNNLENHYLYKKVLRGEPGKYYLPLCSVCNQRMRALKEETRTYSKAFRRRAAVYSGKVGGPQAAKKFKACVASIVLWRAEFGVPKFIRRKYPRCPNYGSHVFNKSGKCPGCEYRKPNGII
jgi:hypothetical protein